MIGPESPGRFYAEDMFRKMSPRDRALVVTEEYKLATVLFLDSGQRGSASFETEKLWGEITHGFALFYASKCYDEGTFRRGADLEKALSYFQLSSKYDPENVRAQTDFGMVLLSIEPGPNSDIYARQSVIVLRNIGEIAPFQRIFLNLAWAYIGTNSFDEAANVFDMPDIENLDFMAQAKPRPDILAVVKACVLSNASGHISFRKAELIEKSYQSLVLACSNPSSDVARIACEEAKTGRDLSNLLHDEKYGQLALEAVSALQCKNQ